MSGRRLLFGLGRVVGTVLVAMTLSWVLAALAPGGLAASAARAEGRAVLSAQGDVELALAVTGEAARRHGLDRGVMPVIAESLASALVGDLGTSWRHDVDIGPLVGAALIPTLALVLLVLAVGAGLGVWAGLRASVRRRPGIAALSAIALAVPPLWVGILAIDAFAAGGSLPLLPRRGWGSPLALVLPVATLAPVVFAVVFRYTADALREFMHTPVALAARARGLAVEAIATRHGLRVISAALAPLGTTLVAYLLGATVVTDRLFDVRGLGWLLLDAATVGDVPVVVAVAGGCALVVALTSALVDWLTRRWDPRLREVSDELSGDDSW